MTLRRRKKNRSTSTVPFFAWKSLNQQNLRGNAEQHQREWEHLIWTWCTVGFELEPALDTRITLCVRPKPPSSSLYTIAKSVGARKSRYNRFLVIYDLVITDICCVYLDTRPNFSTKFARYIRLLVITGLVIYDFYCSYFLFAAKLKKNVLISVKEYGLVSVSFCQPARRRKKRKKHCIL